MFDHPGTAAARTAHVLSYMMAPPDVFLAFPEADRRRDLKDVPRLYKYRSLDPTSTESIQRVRDQIVDDQIWLSCASDFNDPFEGRYRIEIEPSPDIRAKALQRLRGLNPHMSNREWEDATAKVAQAAPMVSAPSTDELWDQHDQHMGFFCATSTPRSVTMWAHYAMNHKGFCIQYSAYQDPLLSVCTSAVHYSTDYPVLKAFSDRREAGDNHYLLKSPEWQHEKEWRIVLPIGPGPLKLQPAAISAIILGCRMPNDARRELMKLINERVRLGKPEPLVYQMYINRKSYRLGAFRYGSAPPPGWLLR